MLGRRQPIVRLSSKFFATRKRAALISVAKSEKRASASVLRPTSSYKTFAFNVSLRRIHVTHSIDCHSRSRGRAHRGHHAHLHATRAGRRRRRSAAAQMTSAGEASYLVYTKESANLSQVSTMTDPRAGYAYNALTRWRPGPRTAARLPAPARSASVVKSFSANVIGVTSNARRGGCRGIRSRSHHAGACVPDSLADTRRRRARECRRAEHREDQGA